MAENLTDTNVGNIEYIRKADAIFDLHTQLMYRMGSDDMKRRLDDWVKTLPSADVVQVRRGKWKYKGVCGIENNIAIRRYKCSECREDIVCDYPYNFCPNCGAKMDEGES